MTTPRSAIENWGPDPIREVPIEKTPFARGGLIPLPPGHQLQVIQPGRAWRIVRMVLAVLGALALLEAIIIMTFMIVLAGNLGSELSRLRNPEPAVTGCPFGEVECGG